MGTPRLDRIERNILINGGMDFFQRVGASVNTLNTATASAFYTADRWRSLTSGPTVKNFSIQRSTDVPSQALSGAISSYSSLFTAITAIPTLNTLDTVQPHTYIIEGYDFGPMFGNAVTYAFWVKSSVAGTFPFALRNSNIDRSYVSTFTISSINTWTPIFIPVTMDTVGTWNFDAAAGVNISIAPAGGATFATTSLNTWQAGNFITTPTATNSMATAGATMRIAQVQCVLGTMTSMPAFKRAGGTISGELRGCQRYYEKQYPPEVAPGTPFTIESGYGYNVGAAGTNVIRGSIPFKMTKRAAPSLSYYDAAGNVGRISIYTNIWNNVQNLTFFNDNVNIIYIGATLSGALFLECGWTADADF